MIYSFSYPPAYVTLVTYLKVVGPKMTKVQEDLVSIRAQGFDRKGGSRGVYFLPYSITWSNGAYYIYCDLTRLRNFSFVIFFIDFGFQQLESQFLPTRF